MGGAHDDLATATCLLLWKLSPATRPGIVQGPMVFTANKVASMARTLGPSGKPSSGAAENERAAKPQSGSTAIATGSGSTARLGGCGICNASGFGRRGRRRSRCRYRGQDRGDGRSGQRAVNRRPPMNPAQRKAAADFTPTAVAGGHAVARRKLYALRHGLRRREA